MMKIRNGEHDHSEFKKPTKRGKKKSAKSRGKANTMPRLITPRLSNQTLRLTPKMPKLTPKTLPKLTPKTENIPPNDDAEFVDILD